MNTLLFITALSLSVTAAYYSIAGLIAIFAAAPISIAVMGSVLEVSKIVTVSWLQRNWSTAPRSLRAYFCVAVGILMIITSLGIFGYLSKAHSDQAVPLGESAAKVALIDEKIKVSRDNIEEARKALRQLDETVNQTIARSSSENSVDKAVSIRRSQTKERARLLQEIETEQKKLSALNEERMPIASQVRKVEAEVGPIKYVASFVYGDTSPELLDRAVTWMIILIIIVFDPLAVLLFLALNINLTRKSNSSLYSENHYNGTSESCTSKAQFEENVNLSDQITIDKTIGRTGETLRYFFK